MISHHLQHENYRNALEVLSKQVQVMLYMASNKGLKKCTCNFYTICVFLVYCLYFSLQEKLELFYKFSPILMQNIPRELVDAWITKKDRLNPRQLIPALVQYDSHKYKAQVGVHTIISYLNIYLFPFKFQPSGNREV